MRLILPFSDFISIFFGRQQLFHAAYIVLTHVPRVCQTAANASHTGKQATISDSSDQSKWKYPGRSWNIFLSDIPNDSPTFLWFSNVNWNKLPCKNTRKWLWSYCSPIGQNNTRVFFCSIRSQHSQSRLEMVWRDSFPRGSYTFIENFRRYDFCPVYFVLPRHNCPLVSKDDQAEVSQ